MKSGYQHLYDIIKQEFSHEEILTVIFHMRFVSHIV